MREPSFLLQGPRDLHEAAIGIAIDQSIDPCPVKMTKNFLINSGFFPVIALGILMFRELEIADTLAYRPKLQDRTGEDFILGRLSIEETSYGDIWM